MILLQHQFESGEFSHGDPKIPETWPHPDKPKYDPVPAIIIDWLTEAVAAVLSEKDKVFRGDSGEVARTEPEIGNLGLGSSVAILCLVFRIPLAR
jgi:hypothetical protein